MTRYESVQEHLKTNQYTWLITGVAGFIGSNLLEKLLTLNQKVIGLDNFATGYQYNIDQALDDAQEILKTNSQIFSPSSFKFINGDIRNLDECRSACFEADFVLHQAALGSVPRSIDDPINTNRANIDGFLNMLIAAKDSNVKRFVYAASSSTYGDHPGLPKVEGRIGNPLSPYAVTKLVNELYAGVFAKTYNFKTIGLRYFNAFGKRQNPKGSYAAVIPKWVSSILNADKVFINGDGETSRDFCYIDNTVQMNILAAMTKNEEATDQVYNVALNASTSLNKLHHMILDSLRKRVHGLKIIKPVYRDFRPGDVLHSLADISKAKELLEYEPTHNLADGLGLSMDWYVKSLSIQVTK